MQADLDEDAVEVEVLAGPAVVAALVLELGEVVARVDHARLEVVTLHQEVQQLLAVPAGLDLLGHLRFGEDPHRGRGDQADSAVQVRGDSISVS